MKLIVTDREGKVHEIDGRADWTAMEIIRDANLPLAAECGGACACATCHVYVDEKFLPLLEPIDDTQEAMLECTATERLPNSRLSCQIKVRPELEGLIVRIPETQK